jgi:hypothetical protein
MESPQGISRGEKVREVVTVRGVRFTTAVTQEERHRQYPSHIPSFNVPAEAFDVTDIESSGFVIGHWVGVPDDEIRAYIQAAKDAGFTNDATESSMETSYMYSARDQTDYRDNRSVSIIAFYAKQASTVRSR